MFDEETDSTAPGSAGGMKEGNSFVSDSFLSGKDKIKGLRAKKILVVDDIEDVHVFFKGVFDILGVECFHAYNGDEAVGFVKKEKGIDLVLMDIKMPGIDGYEATKRIKKERKNLLVVVQSAYAMKDDVQKALKMGFDGYITKPVNIEKLTEKLIALLLP